MTIFRPLFRDDPDVSSMADLGLDLSDYGSEKQSAALIYAALNGKSLHGQTMLCDRPWPPQWIALFKEWMEEGMHP